MVSFPLPKENKAGAVSTLTRKSLSREQGHSVPSSPRAQHAWFSDAALADSSSGCSPQKQREGAGHCHSPSSVSKAGFSCRKGSPAGLCFSIALHFGLFFPFSAAHSWYKGFDTRRLSETGDTRCWCSSGYTYYAEAFTLTDHEHVTLRFFFLSLFFLFPYIINAVK